MSMASLVQGLQVINIPKQFDVTIMWFDVVNMRVEARIPRNYWLLASLTNVIIAVKYLFA